MSRYIVNGVDADGSGKDEFQDIFFTDSSRKALVRAKRLLNTNSTLVIITDQDKGINLSVTLEKGKLKLVKRMHQMALEDSLEDADEGIYTPKEARILLGQRLPGTTKADIRGTIEKRDKLANEAVSDISKAANSFGVRVEVEEDVRELYNRKELEDDSTTL